MCLNQDLLCVHRQGYLRFLEIKWISVKRLASILQLIIYSGYGGAMRRILHIMFPLVLGFLLFAGAVRETCQVNPGICDGCAECYFVCAYGAIDYDSELGSMRINQSLCDGCGDCMSTCSQGAIYYNDGRSFIVGTVRNAESGFGIRNAVVEADTATVVSGLFGDYCLTLREGVHNLRCDAEGYEEELIEGIVVGVDTALVLDISLQPENSVEENELSAGKVVCYPNPVRSAAHVKLSLPSQQSGSVTIYNTIGQKIRTLRLAKDQSSVHWDLRDVSGRAVSSGVYFYRCNAGAQVYHGKILLID